jgi:hypothetical protein
MTIEELQETNVKLVEFKKLWLSLFGEPVVSNHQLLVWFTLHPIERLFIALGKTSIKNQKMLGANEEMTLDHKIRTASEIANRLKDEQEKKENDNEKNK